MTACWRCICNCLRGTRSGNPHTRLKEVVASVVLDPNKIGHDVVVIKNGTRICGSGAALATAPVVQNKSYFEVKIQQQGSWGIGLAPYSVTTTDLDRCLVQDPDSWLLRNDGKVYNSSTVKTCSACVPEEGDILGVSFDHVELIFYLNGEELCRCSGVKGVSYPAVCVDDGAILDTQFSQFVYCPVGYQAIMIEQTLL